MCCVPALFVVVATVHKKFTKILSCKRQKGSQLIIEGVNFRPFSLPTYWGANWKLNDRPNGIWFCHDLPDGGKQNNAAVRFRGRHRKTTFEKTANNPQIFQETVPFYTRDFSYLWGSRLTVKTVIFRRFLFVGAPNGLRIVCGISIRKSVNSAGLEQDFFRQKQAFYSCCNYRYHDPKCDYD